MHGGALLYVLGYHWLPLATIDLVGYSVTAASSFMGKLQPFSYEARTEAC